MDEVLSKSEQERIARSKDVTKRQVKKFIVWLVVLAVIAAAIYGVTAWSRYAAAHKPGVAIEPQGQNHIAGAAPHDPYNSNPPTSGPHYEQPANWGFYDTELPDEQVVHNLEHVGIWITYKDKDNAELKNQVKDIVDRYAIKVIATPRPGNDHAISVAAWGRLLHLDNFDRDRILDFLRAFINRGPEQVPY